MFTKSENPRLLTGVLLPAFLIHVSNSIDDNAKCGLDGTMKIKFVLAGYVTVLSFTFVCSVLPADTKSAIEQALRDLDARWSAAAGSKDLEKTISFYSEDAIVLPTNAPAATTKDAIRNTWKDLLASPGLAISWKTTKVEVAKSGDIAYTTGTYELTMNDASGKPVPDHGKYVEVWKKQSDGKWKVAVDIWNSDIPLPSLEKK